MSRESKPTRRDVLQISGLVGVGAMTGLSGCAGFLQGGGGGTYRNWSFSPSILGQDHYWVLQLDASSIHESRHDFNQDFFDNIRGTEDSIVGVRFDELDDLLMTASGQVSVATGDYEVDTVVEQARSEDYVRDEDYEDYQIYTLEGQESIAISEDNLILAQHTSEQPSTGLAKIAIDTDRGEERRYHEENSNFETLTDQLGKGDFTYAYTQEPSEETNAESGQFENRVGYGAKYDVSGETADVVVKLLFRTEADVSVTDVETWTTTADLWSTFYDLSVEQDGAVATVSGTVDTRDIEGNLLF